MDLNAIRKRLGQLQTTNNRTSSLWKPQPGKTQIRIVPYAFNKDNPFIELFFNYNLNNRSYLSPISFGRPDPIEEFAQKLKASGNKEDYQLSKKLEAKMRTFAPVIVRGEESQGVKFWGFGKTVYQELLSIIADPDYGDITDPVNGRDITVEFKTAAELGKTYPETYIRVKPKTLFEKEIKFDENIKGFHHYDIKFCIDCKLAGLTLGTLDINIIHKSPGLDVYDDSFKDSEKYMKEFLNELKT